MVEDICGMALTHNVAYQGAYGDLHPLALIIAGCYVLVALLLSFFLILQHLRSYTKPSEQKWIVAVVFMVPVYASESIISLWNSRLSLALNILRDCYEAFALYSFGSYLVACLGGEEKVIELLEQESRKQLTKPLLENEQGVVQEQSVLNFFLRPRSLGKDSYSIVKFGLVQYMILKTVCSFLALFLELFGVYGDGEFKWNCGYPYIAVVMNFSQMWALYCLVQFYNVTHERLQPIKPLAKFISIKAIVFATWWQGVGIKLLCAIGVLPKEEKFQNGLQDFLICLEMAIAAVAHIFVFSAKPYHYLPLSEHGKLTVEATKDMVALEEECAVLEGNETHVKAPGTSVTGSVQDVVIEGGQNVVKDVVLTINQAIEPMGKGVTKMQETLQHISASPNAKAGGSDLGVEEHLETRVTESKSHVSSSG